MGGQGDLANLGAGEQEALVSARLGDIRKRVNAESWSNNMEQLISDWGEKAAGLRFMHGHSGGAWKKFSNNLAIGSIIVTSLASTVSLIATSVEDPETKNGILFGVGGIGLISALLQSFKKFYNAEEKAADHGSVSKQFGSFYRYITLQMNMSREDRDPSDVLCAYALKEYERLQQEEIKLVVEGYIEPGYPPYVILTKNQGYFDPINTTTYNELFVNNVDSINVWYFDESGLKVNKSLELLDPQISAEFIGEEIPLYTIQPSELIDVINFMN